MDPYFIISISISLGPHLPRSILPIFCSISLILCKISIGYIFDLPEIQQFKNGKSQVSGAFSGKTAELSTIREHKAFDMNTKFSISDIANPIFSARSPTFDPSDKTISTIKTFVLFEF